MKTKHIIHSLRICGNGRCGECTMCGNPHCLPELRLKAADKLEAHQRDITKGLEKIKALKKRNRDLRKEISTLKKELAARETAPGWISVEERLPEIGKNVLIKYENDFTVGYLQMNNTWVLYYGNGWTTPANTSSSPTHWMPIPAPPKPKKKVKTYKDVFFEAFPNALLAKEIDGIPAACRSLIFGKSNKCSMDANCEDCWNQPYPEEEGESDEL